MKAHQRTVGQCDEWLTPRWILDPLGRFDLDPCAAIVQPWATADRMLTIDDDGLNADWGGGCFVTRRSIATSAQSGWSAWPNTTTGSC